jgi:hypothetical protein
MADSRHLHAPSFELGETSRARRPAPTLLDTESFLHLKLRCHERLRSFARPSYSHSPALLHRDRPPRPARTSGPGRPEHNEKSVGSALRVWRPLFAICGLPSDAAALNAIRPRTACTHPCQHTPEVFPRIDNCSEALGDVRLRRRRRRAKTDLHALGLRHAALAPEEKPVLFM